MQDPIPSLLPANRVHLLGGPSQAGKTTFLAWMLKQIQDGNVVLGEQATPPTGIYYITCDQPWSDYQYICDKVGLRVDGHYSYLDDPEMTPTLFEDMNVVSLLRRGMNKLGPPAGSIVVVDVLGIFFNDLMKYRHVMGCMLEYSKWCAVRDITMIGTVHAGKQSMNRLDRYARLFDRVIGGNPMRCIASTVMYLTSREESEVDGAQQFEVCPRHAKNRMYHCKWDDAGLLTPDGTEVIGSGPDLGESNPDIFQLLEWVPYENPGITTKDWTALAINKLGISRATFFRWRDKLIEQNVVLAGDKSGTWTKQREA
jgi:hypothetical protein